MADGYISQVSLPTTQIYDIKDKTIARMFYGTTTGSFTNSTIRVSSPNFLAEDLEAGTVIQVGLNYNIPSTNNLQLSVNETTAKPVQYIYHGTYSNIPGSYLTSGQIYQFTYDGSYWIVTLSIGTNAFEYLENISTGSLISTCGNFVFYGTDLFTDVAIANMNSALDGNGLQIGMDDDKWQLMTLKNQSTTTAIENHLYFRRDVVGGSDTANWISTVSLLDSGMLNNDHTIKTGDHLVIKSDNQFDIKSTIISFNTSNTLNYLNQAGQWINATPAIIIDQQSTTSSYPPVLEFSMLGASTTANLPIASTSYFGVTKLSEPTNNDTLAATAKSVYNLQQQVNNLLADEDALVFKGVIAGMPSSTHSGAGNLTPAAECGWTYKVNTNGYINGNSVEIGDMLICVNDDTPQATTSGDNMYNTPVMQNNWVIVQNNVDGAVYKGISPFDDDCVIIADGTNGLVQTIDLTTTTATSVSACTTFITAVTQNSRGKINVSIADLDTTGEWKGVAYEAIKPHITPNVHGLAYYNTTGAFASTESPPIGQTIVGGGTSAAPYWYAGLILSGTTANDFNINFNNKVILESDPSNDVLTVEGNSLFKGNILPSVTGTSSTFSAIQNLGSSTAPWKGVYIGTGQAYGDEYNPIYWNNSGQPERTTVTQKITFSLNGGANATATFTHTAVKDNTEVTSIVVNSGYEALNGIIEWDLRSSTTGYDITLTAPVKASATIGGYILVTNG